VYLALRLIDLGVFGSSFN